MADFNFKIDPANYAGIDHESYRADMLQLALAQPTEYTKLRKAVLNIVKKEAVNSQYGIYYYLLTAGQEAGVGDGGDSILKGSTAGLQAATVKMFVPKVPAQIVNEFAFKALYFKWIFKPLRITLMIFTKTETQINLLICFQQINIEQITHL